MLKYTLKPSFYELDWMGIVSNLSYVRWLEDIRSRLLDISPYPMSRLMAEQLSPTLFTTHIDYIAPYIGTDGGVVEVEIRAGERMGRSRWELKYEFYQVSVDRHLASALQLGCFVGLPSLKPTRIPAEMRHFFETKLGADSEGVLS